MKVVDRRTISKHMQSVEPQMLPTKYGFEQFYIRPISIINGVVSNKKAAI